MFTSLETLQSEKTWNDLNLDERNKLIEDYGEPFVLKKVKFEIGSRQLDGHCPGNENSLAAMTLLKADTPPEMTNRLRERMQEKHSIEILGPIMHFYVDGISPRILFTNLTIDANGNIFKPGMLYSYSPNQLANFQILASSDSELGKIKPINDIDLSIQLNPVRRLENLPTHIGANHLVNQDNQTADLGPEIVAGYLKDLLMNEVREKNGTLQFYKELVLSLPEIFNNTESDLVKSVKSKKDFIAQKVVGSPENDSKYLRMDPKKTYRAVENPLNSLYPESYATYIVMDDEIKGYYFFVQANELLIV